VGCVTGYKSFEFGADLDPVTRSLMRIFTSAW